MSKQEPTLAEQWEAIRALLDDVERAHSATVAAEAHYKAPIPPLNSAQNTLRNTREAFDEAVAAVRDKSSDVLPWAQPEIEE